MFGFGQWLAVCLVFMWSGFVRSGLGFGGAVLALPFLLLINPDLTLWLPAIAIHVIIFSFITLCKSFFNVDWRFFLRVSVWIIPAKIIGIFGLLNLPVVVLVSIAYTITTLYGVCWALGINLKSKNIWQDRAMLAFGGYVSGTLLSGGPVLVPVFVQYVAATRLRSTLFALWFVLGGFKLVSFIVLDVPLQWAMSLILIPAAVIGDVIGLFFHKKILTDEKITQKAIGYGLLAVSVAGLIKVLV